MNPTKKIAVIGGGSWATAIVKMLTATDNVVGWWVRDEKQVQHIKKHHHNPRYLRSVELPVHKIILSSDLNQVIAKADYLIFAVPSAFLKLALENLTVDIKDKVIVSAIKGIVPDDKLIVGEFFNEVYKIPIDQICVITGPCHAEEVGMERLSYLTIASTDEEHATFVARALECEYIKVNISDDIYGTEYGAVLKNIYALAAGIFHGLGYGDNFQAVLVSNAIREMNRFIKAVHPIKRNINGSAYLGDLLVTAYSQFSRNRTFGEMIGRGYSVNSAQLQLKMIAEGYYAVKCIMEINEKLEVEMPITEAVYNVLYDRKSAKKQIKLLTDRLN